MNSLNYEKVFIFFYFESLKTGIKFVVILESYRNFLNLNPVQKWF
ncbi:hypothetical protein LEP1GSC106_0488 [Leptospira interrogans serovar Grippotyphosa str. UI 12764]|nr:hypothetical protein LEP1GSC106_0488 [Leptospira interrogans serovar Grippotyphosa str. UI 12764]